MSDPSDPIYLIILGTIMMIVGVIVMYFANRPFIVKVGTVIAIIGIIPFVLGLAFHLVD